MMLENLIGHGDIVERFTRSVRRNRLANTWLFTGREGIGKRTLALGLARALLCIDRKSTLEACGRCRSCRQVEAQTHPDLLLVSKPADKNFIPIELIVGDREHRRRQGLCHDISLTPFEGDRKIAIIDDADYLNVESANSLLKTLEEPPPDSILILIGTSEHRQLPTILSRSQVVRFQPLNDQELTTVLSRQELSGEIEIEKLVAAADGSVERAIHLDNPELFQFRDHLLTQLACGDPAVGGFSKTFCEFVENISKEAAIRRSYLQLLGDFAIQLYRHTLRAAVQTGDDESDATMSSLSNQLIGTGRNRDDTAEVVADCIHRTFEFQRHVAANLATANIVPAWLNDLGAIRRREKACS